MKIHNVNRLTTGVIEGNDEFYDKESLEEVAASGIIKIADKEDQRGFYDTYMLEYINKRDMWYYSDYFIIYPN